MALTVNLRNDTSLFIKVNGIEGVIVPNTSDEDKTIQWFGTDNKTIEFFTTIECVGSPLGVGNLSFITNDGIYVNRGDFSSQIVKMQADALDNLNYVVQTTNGQEQKLLDWPTDVDGTVINLSFWNL